MQESLRGDFQKTAPKPKLSVAEALDHAARYVQNIEMDYERASRGLALRYQAPNKRKKCFKNGGRAPDSTKDLVAKKSTVGRPVGRRNNIPKLGNDIDWSSFGIHWSFKYYRFQATNTCPLNTTLMAFYLLHRFQNPIILAEVSNPAATALHKVLNEITVKHYSKARFLWCTEVLQIQNDGSRHDLIQDVNSAFLDHLPDLVTFEARFSSTYASPLCPMSHRVLTKRYRQIIIRHPRKLTQDELESSIIPNEADCDERVDEAVLAEHGHDMFQLKSNLNLGKDEYVEGSEYVCGRLRKPDSIDGLNTPALLVLNCLEYWAATKQECYHPPVRSLVFSKGEYSLGAIIYGDGAHFCCHIFVQGGVLFYDGMAKRKLSWGNTQSVNIPTGFIINQMWYVRHNGSPGQTLGSFPCAICQPDIP